MTSICKCGVVYEKRHERMYCCDECRAKKDRQYYQRNKSSIREKKRKRYHEHGYREYYRNYMRGYVKGQRNDKEWDARVLLRLLLKNAKRGGSRRGKPIQISVDYLVTLWDRQEQRCAISGMSMDRRMRSLRCCSIDRIDNSEGYVDGNVQLVCRWVNWAKNNHSNMEIISIINELKSMGRLP